jgi:hypothetical protein
MRMRRVYRPVRRYVPRMNCCHFPSGVSACERKSRRSGSTISMMSWYFVRRPGFIMSGPSASSVRTLPVASREPSYSHIIVIIDATKLPTNFFFSAS